MTGEIVSVVEAKGFGFIRPDSQPAGKQDVFFHVSALAGGLSWHDTLLYRRVQFELASGTRGLKAVDVRPLT